MKIPVLGKAKTIKPCGKFGMLSAFVFKVELNFLEYFLRQLLILYYPVRKWRIALRDSLYQR